MPENLVDNSSAMLLYQVPRARQEPLFSELPVELIIRIATHLSPSDLFACTRLSKKLGRIVTPLLYRVITLWNCPAAVAFFRTLDSASDKDHLSNAVRVLDMKFARPESGGDLNAWRELRVSDCIRPMTHLQSISCSSGGIVDQQLCHVLLEIRSLRRVALVVSDTSSVVDVSPSASPLDMQFPLDHSSPVELFHMVDCSPERSDRYNFLIRYMLSGHKLQNLLLLGLDSPRYWTLIPQEGQLRSIVSVGLPYLSPSILGALRRMPNLRRLAIFAQMDPDTAIYDGGTHLPLETLACESQGLQSLVSICNEQLRCVQLDGSSYPHDEVLDHLFSRWGAFGRLARILIPLGSFTSSLRYLSIAIGTPYELIIGTVSPYFSALETLVVRFKLDNPTAGQLPRLPLGIFACAPKLKTLLFAVYSLPPWEEDIPLQNDIIDGWAKACSTLQTVAFSVRYLWTKEDRIWVRDETPEDFVPSGSEESFRRGNGWDDFL